MSRRKANPTVLDQIVSRDPETMSGAPVFAGTRVPIQALIDHLSENSTIEEFVEGFPTVEPEQAVEFLRRVGELVADGELSV